MAIRRFYCEHLDQSPVALSDEDAAHARKSLRLTVGDTIELFDGAGTVAAARIAELTRRCVAEISDRRRIARPAPYLEVAAALPKGPRADVMVEKLSELGVDHLSLLTTERSVVDPREKKVERFRRSAIESAKQCGRAWLMAIGDPTPLPRILASADHDVKLFADVQELQQPADVASMVKGSQRVLVLVGPEGGWTDAERAGADEAGCRSWRLGPHVMRVETAAIAAAACVRFSTE